MADNVDTIGVSLADLIVASDPCAEASVGGAITSPVVPPVVGVVDPSYETAMLGVVGGGDVQQETGDQIQGDLFSSGDAESLKGTHNSSSP